MSTFCAACGNSMEASDQFCRVCGRRTAAGGGGTAGAVIKVDAGGSAEKCAQSGEVLR